MASGSKIGSTSKLPSSSAQATVDTANAGENGDALARSKENVKALLAASGIDVAPQGKTSSQARSSRSPQPEAMNGGKKRWRSGSLIETKHHAMASRKRETSVEKIQLEQYVNREYDHKALLASQRNE